MKTTSSAATFIEAVRESLVQAGRFNPDDAVAPAAILWTDADGQWQPLVEKLRPLMPELFTLGPYQPEQRTGPVIWLRCVIERVLPEVKLPEDVIPVLYLPNVSRQTLRAAEDCPDDLKPLVELQYRGVVWTQRNGKDWTVEAFLVSEDGGLGLDVAREQKTRQAMLGALRALAATPVAALRGKRLEAEDFDRLMIGDPHRELLLWLSDPAGMRSQWDDDKWAAFRSRCKADYGFDPETDGEIAGGEKLGLRQGPWQLVWHRFAESPALYPGIPELLRRSRPSTLIFDREPWPDENDRAEEELRSQLVGLGGKNAAEARSKIADLEKKHGERRQWVWRKLGKSPLAEALEHLALVASNTENVLGGDTPEQMADLYARGAFVADAAALKALASVKSAEDLQAVSGALRAVYLPWLDDSARNFQRLVETRPLPDAEEVRESPPEYLPRQCVVFCDGFRFDLAQTLLPLAEERGLRVKAEYRWAALPTVTGTAKPAIAPIIERLKGLQIAPDFEPSIERDAQPLNSERFRRMLSESGYQVLGQAEAGLPASEQGRGWTEYGGFDGLGHKLQTGMVGRLQEELGRLVDRIVQLLEAGWESVKLVTDHGWLLLPGGLPAVPLPKYLTETRWSRCAAIKEGARVGVPRARWHWNRDLVFAHAPGVHCFGKGHEYAHGGVSIQECLIPDLTFHLARKAGLPTVAVKEIQWLGLRCRVAIGPAVSGLRADLRTKPNDAGSSVSRPKSFDKEGRVGLLVENESLAGTVVSLVVLDGSGRVIAKRPTTIGGEQ